MFVFEVKNKVRIPFIYFKILYARFATATNPKALIWWSIKKFVQKYWKISQKFLFNGKPTKRVYVKIKMPEPFYVIIYLLVETEIRRIFIWLLLKMFSFYHCETRSSSSILCINSDGLIVNGVEGFDWSSQFVVQNIRCKWLCSSIYLHRPSF